MADQEKQYEVFTPAKDFTGRRYGVVFKNGRGMATQHQAIVLMVNWKYRCPQLEEERKPKATAPPALKLDMVEEPKPEVQASVAEAPASIAEAPVQVAAMHTTASNNSATRFQPKPKGK